jgi:hypothetical protein
LNYDKTITGPCEIIDKDNNVIGTSNATIYYRTQKPRGWTGYIEACDTIDADEIYDRQDALQPVIRLESDGVIYKGKIFIETVDHHISEYGHSEVIRFRGNGHLDESE